MLLEETSDGSDKFQRVVGVGVRDKSSYLCVQKERMTDGMFIIHFYKNRRPRSLYRFNKSTHISILSNFNYQKSPPLSPEVCKLSLVKYHFMLEKMSPLYCTRFHSSYL